MGNGLKLTKSTSFLTFLGESFVEHSQGLQRQTRLGQRGEIQQGRKKRQEHGLPEITKEVSKTLCLDVIYFRKSLRRTLSPGQDSCHSSLLQQCYHCSYRSFVIVCLLAFELLKGRFQFDHVLFSNS